jgi:type II secretory pathway component GspD/PulD (secretin)
MRRFIAAACVLGQFLILPAVYADDAPRSVTIDVLIASIPRDSAPEEMTPAAVLALEKAGKLQWQTRLQLATIENERASVQVGEHAPVVTGRTSRGGFGGDGAQNVTTVVNVGTTVEAMAQVAADDSIVIGLTVERSWLEPVANDRDDAPPPLPSHRTCTLNSKTTVRAVPGEPTLVAAQSSAAEGKHSQFWIVLKASASGKPAAADERAAHELRVFRLKFAAAADAAKILSGVFDEASLKIVAEERTNSLLIHSPPATQEKVEALLRLLDAEQPKE